MNVSTAITAGLTALEKSEISLLLGSLVSLGGLTSSVVIRTVTASSLSAAGLVAETATSATVSGTLGPLTAEEIEANPLYQVDDQELLVKAADLSVAPSSASTVTSSGTAYKVIATTEDALSATYRIIIRRAA